MLLCVRGAPSGDMTQGDLIRNLPDWEQADVIFAWHLGARNQLLMQLLYRNGILHILQNA